MSRDDQNEDSNGTPSEPPNDKKTKQGERVLYLWISQFLQLGLIAVVILFVIWDSDRFRDQPTKLTTNPSIKDQLENMEKRIVTEQKKTIISQLQQMGEKEIDSADRYWRLTYRERLLSLTTELKQLDSRLNNSSGKLEDLLNRIPKPQLDVYILATKSKNLQLNKYQNAIIEVLLNPPVPTELMDYRVGMYIATYGQLNEYFDPEAGKFSKGSRISNSKSDTTDNLNEITDVFLKQFPKDRPKRRCIIIASDLCDPPNSTQKWQALAPVYTILLPNDAESFNKNDPQKVPKEVLLREQQWATFCNKLNGKVILLNRVPFPKKRAWEKVDPQLSELNRALSVLLAYRIPEVRIAN